MSYDAILFDFDGVFAAVPDRTTLARAARSVHERLGLSTASADETLLDVVRGDLEGLTARCRRWGVGRDEYLATAAREAVRTQVAAFESGLRSVYDDCEAVLAIDRPTAVVTDNHRAVVDYFLRRTGLVAAVDAVRACSFAPDGFDRRKPAPANLEAAMTALDADDGLHVGDRAVDVAAARRAGLDACLLRRGDGGAENVREHVGASTAPTFAIDSLRELPDRLAGA